MVFQLFVDDEGRVVIEPGDYILELLGFNKPVIILNIPKEKANTAISALTWHARENKDRIMVLRVERDYILAEVDDLVVRSWVDTDKIKIDLWCCTLVKLGYYDEMLFSGKQKSHTTTIVREMKPSAYEERNVWRSIVPLLLRVEGVNERRLYFFALGYSFFEIPLHRRLRPEAKRELVMHGVPKDEIRRLENYSITVDYVGQLSMYSDRDWYKELIRGVLKLGEHLIPHPDHIEYGTVEYGNLTLTAREDWSDCPFIDCYGTKLELKINDINAVKSLVNKYGVLYTNMSYEVRNNVLYNSKFRSLLARLHDIVMARGVADRKELEATLAELHKALKQQTGTGRELYA